MVKTNKTSSDPQVLGFHYTLKNKEDKVLDSSDGGAPLLVLLGRGQILPALEAVISTMKIGQSKQVLLTAEEGYGPAREDLRLSVARAQFPPEADLRPGVQFQVNNDPAAPLFTVTHIEDETVHIDGNHPLAGEALSFDVKITEKRPASAQEIAHGHAHGPGGHAH